MKVPYQCCCFLCEHLNKAKSSNHSTDLKQQYFLILNWGSCKKVILSASSKYFSYNYSVANFCFVPFLFNVLNLLQYRENTVPQENKAAKSSSIFLKLLTLYCIEGKKKSLFNFFSSSKLDVFLGCLIFRWYHCQNTIFRS